jgi:cobalt-zinc-cadmium efflux system protein
VARQRVSGAHRRARGRGHGHGHGHGHHALSGSGHGRPLAIVLCITFMVLAVEAVGAFWSGSLALLADAGHMLTDVAGLSLALVAAVLADRPATDARTWGYRRAEVLAAGVQAAVLLVVGGFVLVDGVHRLVEPPEVASGPMAVFGVVGLVGNTVSILLLARVSGGDLNIRAAMMEVVNDALGSIAVLVAAAAIALTGWLRADAVVSLLIGVMILPRTWKLLRETVHVLMEATPKDVNLAVVRAHILDVSHVLAVHDLHASTVASGLPVLTAHVVVENSCFYDGHLPQLLEQLQQCLAGHFDLEHSTFQFEWTGHAVREHATHP